VTVRAVTAAPGRGHHHDAIVMAPDPRRASVPEHITSIARRTDAEAHRLTRTLAARCWPGPGDRREPVAAGWLRRWGPSGNGAALRLCACDRGHCAVCN
jgi:hypothetical protein